LEKSTSYEAPHYAVFSNLLSLHLSSVNSTQPVEICTHSSNLPDIFKIISLAYTLIIKASLNADREEGTV
jgi:hypothetical protein